MTPYELEVPRARLRLITLVPVPIQPRVKEISLWYPSSCLQIQKNIPHLFVLHESCGTEYISVYVPHFWLCGSKHKQILRRNPLWYFLYHLTYRTGYLGSRNVFFWTRAYLFRFDNRTSLFHPPGLCKTKQTVEEEIQNHHVFLIKFILASKQQGFFFLCFSVSLWDTHTHTPGHNLSIKNRTQNRIP